MEGKMEENTSGLKVDSGLLDDLRVVSRDYKTFDIRRKNSMSPEKRREFYGYFIEKIAEPFSNLITLAEKDAEFDLLASFYIEMAPKKATVICEIMGEEKEKWPTEKVELLEKAIKRQLRSRRGKARSNYRIPG